MGPQMNNNTHQWMSEGQQRQQYRNDGPSSFNQDWQRMQEQMRNQPQQSNFQAPPQRQVPKKYPPGRVPPKKKSMNATKKKKAMWWFFMILAVVTGITFLSSAIYYLVVY